jgi:hypothetical protein
LGGEDIYFHNPATLIFENLDKFFAFNREFTFPSLFDHIAVVSSKKIIV